MTYKTVPPFGQPYRAPKATAKSKLKTIDKHALAEIDFSCASSVHRAPAAVKQRIDAKEVKATLRALPACERRALHKFVSGVLKHLQKTDKDRR
jgi:iron-sulfur cluster repair protein YtfE (RIC family)